MPSVLEALTPRFGEELGVSDWLMIDQARIDAFAACTEDFQWIHVDQARAAEGPFGGTIAHGFLTLSMLPRLTGQMWLKDAGIEAALNYGLDRVRFMTPVRSGSRIRNRLRLLTAEIKGPGRTLVSFENTVEMQSGEIEEGAQGGAASKPAMIAHTLVMAIG